MSNILPVYYIIWDKTLRLWVIKTSKNSTISEWTTKREAETLGIDQIKTLGEPFHIKIFKTSGRIQSGRTYKSGMLKR